MKEYYKKKEQELSTAFKCFLILLLLALYNPMAKSQLLLYDGFDYELGGQPAIPLDDLNDGFGWGGIWNVQNNNIDIPGYNITDATPLSYKNLNQSDTYATGGSSYLTAFRGLDVTTTGAFQGLLNSNDNLGEAGTEIWISALLRDNSDRYRFGVYDNSFDHRILHINKNTTTDMWELIEDGGTTISTDTSVVSGETILAVMHISFTASNATVDLFINPDSLGGTAPTTPSASLVTAAAIEFDGIMFYPGPNPDNGQIDEIRIGTSYAEVTPVTVTSPTIDPIPDQGQIYNIDGQQTVSLSGITDGIGGTSDISISYSSDNQTVIPDANISLDYTTPNTTGTLTYEPVVGTSGTVNITLTISSIASGTITESFEVEVLDGTVNYPPVIDPVDNIVIASTSTGTQIVNLSGIADGDANKIQSINIVATQSTSNGIISNVQTNYTSDNTEGTVSFEITGVVGTDDITITVTDGEEGSTSGDNDSVLTFTIEVVDPGNFGLIENFNDNTLTGWYGGNFILTEANEELLIEGSREDMWDAWDYNFSLIDISSSPYVNLKVKTTDDFNLIIGVGYHYWNDNGDGTYTWQYGVQYPTGIQLGQYNFGAEHEIVASEHYEEYAFNYSGLTDDLIVIDLDTIGATIIEVTDNLLKNIDNLHFLPNPMGLYPQRETEPKIWLDDLLVGVLADAMPTVATVRDQAFTVEASGMPSKTAKLRNITDGTDDSHAVTINATSSNTSLLPNPVVTYSSGRNGELLLEPNDNIVGESDVTVTVSSSGTSDKVMSFKVNVYPNAAPEIDTISEQLVVKDETYLIMLTGINDGNFESEQLISISAASSNTGLIPDPSITYDGEGSNATLDYTVSGSATPGSVVTITLTLSDDGGTTQGGINTSTFDFDISIYDEINHAPSFNLVNDFGVNAIAGSYSIIITGINDGDDGSQAIGIEVSNSNESIVTNVSIGNIINGEAILNYDLTGSLGSSDISITLADTAGNAGNNGNKSYSQIFTLTTKEAPVTGIMVDFEAGGIPADYGFSGEGSYYQLNIENGQLHVHCDYPAYAFPGMWFNFTSITGGKELDISNSPYISIKIRNSISNNNGVDDETRLIFFLWDNDDDAAYANTSKELFFTEDGEWQDFLVDFNGDFYNSEDGQIDSSRLVSVLINLDNRYFYPVIGDYWIDEIRIGDSVDFAPPSQLSMDNVPNQTLLRGETSKSIMLTGLSDGNGGDNIDINVIVENPTLVSNVTIGEISNGEALLSYTAVSDVIDQSNITLVADIPTETNDILDTVVFTVFVTDKQDITDTVTFNFNTEFQTYRGMGAVVNGFSYDNWYQGIDQMNDLNFTLMRIVGFDYIEPSNDNNDPYVIERGNLVINPNTIDEIREINENTNCQQFFYSVFTPPAWMKINKSEYPFGGVGYAGNNHLNPDYYEEYAEFLIEIIKTIKEQAGVDLYAISIQNEPAFNEPYRSMQVSPQEFIDIIKVVGPRFDAEGINTKILLSEDVVYNGTLLSSRVNAVNDDPATTDYLDVIGYHGYSIDGISPDFGSNAVLSGVATMAANTSASDVWMTEASQFVNSWNGEWSIAWNGDKIFKVGPMILAGGIYANLKYAKANGFTGCDWDTESDDEQIRAAFKHFSNFIDVEAKITDAVSTDNDNLLALSFKNPDGTKGGVLINWDNVPKVVRLEGTSLPSLFGVVTSEEFNVMSDRLPVMDSVIILPAKSITTITDDLKNLPPEMDALGNLTMLQSDGAVIINISGINDGNPEFVQNISMNVSSSDESVATVTHVYTPNETTGTLTLSPVGYGDATITISLKDDGGTLNSGVDSSSFTFNVSVISEFNNDPVIDVISTVNVLEDGGTYTINLTGIGDGDDGLQNLTLNATSTSTIISTPILVYNPGNSTASITFNPLADMNGIASINLSIEDDGGTATNNGNQSISRIININVEPVNDAPTIEEVDDISVPAYIASFPKRVDGIKDGDPELEQYLTVTAVSSDESFVLIDVDYVYPDSSCTLTINFLEETNASAVVSVTVQDDGGTSNGGVNDTTITFNVSLNLSNGIIEQNTSMLSVFPMPAYDVLNISWEGEISTAKIEIVSTDGKKVLSERVCKNPCELNINNLMPGLYILKVNLNDSIISKKIIKE